MKMYVLLLLGVWFGLVLGLSFIEAPLKFQAPGITTELGLGIGRLVFGFSNKVQLVLLALLLISTALNIDSISKFATGLVLFEAAILGVQTFYLLPALDLRAQHVINGQTVASSSHHHIFVALEIIKLIALAVLYKNLYYQWET